MNFIQRNSYFVIICLLCAGAALIGAVQSVNEEYTEVVISEGDTLWDLSERYADVKIPKDKWIAQVMKMNDLQTTMIRKGDTLIVPEREVVKHHINQYEMAGIGQ